MNNKAIIIDLDGTLVNNSAIAKDGYIPMPKDIKDPAAYWEPFFEESIFADPNYWCLEIVENMYAKGCHIIFLTGRSATTSTVAATKKWLEANLDEDIQYDLIMRPNGDERQDSLVKKDLLSQYITPNYFVLFAIDDKRSNVDMFESMGIKCLHCADY